MLEYSISIRSCICITSFCVTTIISFTGIFRLMVRLSLAVRASSITFCYTKAQHTITAYRIIHTQALQLIAINVNGIQSTVLCVYEAATIEYLVQVIIVQ
jgi:hypothetical protein